MPGYPKVLDLNKIPSRPKKRKKIVLVYDEEKRREFLGGFHKRKVQRQKKAQEELKQKLKEERKRIKQEARDRFKTLLSSRDIPELDQLLSQQEYETEGHTVSILELNVADLAGGAEFIGENKVVYEEEEEEREEGEIEAHGESQEGIKNVDEVEGMELKRKAKCKKEEEPKVDSSIKDKKNLKRAIKEATLKQMKKSKIFQHKQKLEHEKNKKQARKKLHREQKRMKLLCRKRGGGGGGGDKKMKKKSHR